MSQDFAGRLHWIGQSDIAFYLARLEAENARLLSENLRLHSEVSALKMRVMYASNSVRHLEEVCKDLLLEKESTTRMLRTNYNSVPVVLAARGVNSNEVRNVVVVELMSLDVNFSISVESSSIVSLSICECVSSHGDNICLLQVMPSLKQPDFAWILSPDSLEIRSILISSQAGGTFTGCRVVFCSFELFGISFCCVVLLVSSEPN